MKDWFSVSPLNSFKMAHTVFRMCHFEEFVEVALQKCAYSIRDLTHLAGQF